MYLYFIFLTMITCAKKKKIYVKVGLNQSSERVVTANQRTVRLKRREVMPSIEDPSVAEYQDMGDGKFKLKYYTGYLCKHTGSPGLVICKNKREKFTEWKKDHPYTPSKMKTEGNCMKIKNSDTTTENGGWYLNAGVCYYGENDKWHIQNVEIEAVKNEQKTKGVQMEGEM